MCHPEAAAAATLLLAPLSASLLCLALSADAWGQVLAGPHGGHQVLGRFGPCQARLYARFLPDPAQAWRIVPPPLRIPSIPLEHLVRGPPGVRRFRRRMRGPEDDGSLNDEPGFSDLEIVLAESSDGWVVDEQNWDARRYDHLLAAAGFAQSCACVALLMLVLGFVAEVIACVCVRFAHSGASMRVELRLLFRVPAVLYLMAGLLAPFGFIRFAAAFHHTFKVLVSEFLFNLTEGDVTIWPADLEVWFTGGAYACLGSAAVAIPSSLLLFGCDPARLLSKAACAGTGTPLDGSLVTEQAGPPRFVQVRSANFVLDAGPFHRDLSGGTEDELQGRSEVVAPDGTSHWGPTLAHRALVLQQLEATRAELRAHNTRVLISILGFMVVFVLFFSTVAFFLGRRAVEQGLQNALRGPQLRVKQAELAIQQVGQDAHNTVLGIPNAGFRAVFYAFNGAKHAASNSACSAVQGATGVALTAQAATRSLLKAALSQDWTDVQRHAAASASGIARNCADAAGSTCRFGILLVRGSVRAVSRLGRCWRPPRLALEQHLRCS